MIKLLICLLCISPSLQADDYIVKAFKTDKKEIALTFDDGPKKNIHKKILVTLNFFQIKASFFYLGTQIYKHPDLVLKASTYGHTLGNHSYSHTDVTTLKKKGIQKEISESQKVFYDVLGEYPQYFRAPYGSIKKSQLKWFRPYFKKIVKWNIDPRDWSETVTDQEILNYIAENVTPGSIILLHENKKTLKVLPQIIIMLKKKGYTFVTIAEALDE
jgi:peptidoglycan-N-acetylglucosamine deacetylase